MTGEQDGERTSEPGSSDRTEHGTVVRRERFSGGPARSFLSSLAADRRIFEADLAVDRAHVVMLAETGIIEESAAGTILRALGKVENEGYGALPEGEDVHEAIESAVIDRVGPTGGRMHTARSRNDEVATCIRYRLRTDLLTAAETAGALRSELISQARDHTETVIPGFTHGQYAQPVTVGHFLASYAGAATRDTARLLDAYDRTNRSPLGAAAFAGTPFGIDRQRTADLLGFDAVIENSTDAVAARDFLIEACAALAAHATTCSSLAADLIGFTSEGYIDLDDDYASTSSIMPQKKNPDSLELVRATAGDAVGDLTAVLTTLKGLPRAYNRDLQRATPHAWDATDTVVEASEVTAGAIGTARWDDETCMLDAGRGFSTATGVADALAAAGIPFRIAHELVATVAESADPDTVSDPEALMSDLERAASEVLEEPLFGIVDRETILATLDPIQNVAARDSKGGPAPEAVEASLSRMSEREGEQTEAVRRRAKSLSAATDRLNEEVARYA